MVSQPVSIVVGKGGGLLEIPKAVGMDDGEGEVAYGNGKTQWVVSKLCFKQRTN